MFDGAAVRVGPPSPPSPLPSLPPSPHPIPNGTWPLSRLSVRCPMRTRPTIDRTGASHDPTGPIPYGSRARGGFGRTGRVMPAPASRDRAAAGGGQDRRRLGMRAGRGGVADLQLERLEPAELAARRAARRRRSGRPRRPARRCRPTEGDPVEDVTVALEGQRRVAVAGEADPGHGQAEDRDERLGVARAVGREAGQVAMEAVVHARARAARGRSPGWAADPVAPRPRRAPRTARRRSAIARRRSRSRRRRRGRRVG